MKRPGFFRLTVIYLGCGLITVAIGAANIYLGILAMPIMYGIANSLSE